MRNLNHCTPTASRAASLKLNNPAYTRIKGPGNR